MKGLHKTVFFTALVVSIFAAPFAVAQRINQLAPTIVSQTVPTLVVPQIPVLKPHAVLPVVPQPIFQPVPQSVSLTAHEVVDEYAVEILATINEGRESFELEPEKLTAMLATLLEPIIDFKSISKAVMGKHRKAATAEQKVRFTEIFKLTMVRLYAKAMITLGVESVLVLEDENKHPSLTKAKVIMEVGAADEASYSVIYTMRKNKQKEWRVRNIILDGINLGLTYLNQFDSAVNRYSGDIDKVLDGWGREDEELSETQE